MSSCITTPTRPLAFTGWRCRSINYHYPMVSPLLFGTFTGPPIVANLPLGVNN